jgi:hypothetical protein
MRVRGYIGLLVIVSTLAERRECVRIMDNVVCRSSNKSLGTGIHPLRSNYNNSEISFYHFLITMHIPICIETREMSAIEVVTVVYGNLIRLPNAVYGILKCCERRLHMYLHT